MRGGEAMLVRFKGAHFPQEIILMGVRWYVAYPLSYRHVEELMEERGVLLDHATIQRWVVKYSRSVGRSIPPPQAPGRAPLAHGRDLHSGQRRVAVFVSSGGQVRANY